MERCAAIDFAQALTHPTLLLPEVEVEPWLLLHPKHTLRAIRFASHPQEFAPVRRKGTLYDARQKIKVPVYNLEVEGDHVYRVGQSGVLVHNASVPSSDLTKQVKGVLEEHGCCLNGELSVFVSDVPWSSLKEVFPADSGVVYLLRHSRQGKIMKVGVTGSKWATWKSRWDDHGNAEELCGMFDKTLLIDAWSFPWKKDDPNHCVPTRERIETALRKIYCKVKGDCPWDNSFTVDPGPGVPGAPSDSPGHWNGCRWVQGPHPNPKPPHKKGLTEDQVRNALRQTNWNNSAAGRLLGVTEGAIRQARIKFGINPP